MGNLLFVSKLAFKCLLAFSLIVLSASQFFPVSAEEQSAFFLRPRTLGFDEGNNLLYVAEAYGGTISIFDTEPDLPKLLYRFNPGLDAALKVVTDPSTGYAYILFTKTREIVFFDGKKVRAGDFKEGRISLPPAERPTSVLLNVIPAGDGARIYIIYSGFNAKVLVADIQGNVQKTIKIDRELVSTAYDKARDSLYVSYGASFSAVTRIDLASGDKKEILLPYSVGILVFNSSSKTLVALDALGPRAVVVNEEDNARSIDLPFQAHMGHSDGTGILLGSYFHKDLLYLNDTLSITKIPQRIHPLAFKLANGKAIAIGHNGFVGVSDLATKQEVAWIDGGARNHIVGPFQLFQIIDVDSSGSVAYVVNEDSDRVFRINLITGEKRLIGVREDDRSGAPISHPANAVFWRNLLVVANFDGYVSLFDRNSQAVVGEVLVGSPLDDVINYSDRIFAVSGKAKKIYEIDPEKKTVTGTTALGEQTEETGGKLTFPRSFGEGQDGLVVTDEITGEWFVVDPSTSGTVASGHQPGALFAMPQVTADSVISGNFEKGTIVVQSRSKPSESQEFKLPAGFRPLAVDLDRKSNELIVFSINLAGDAKMFVLEQNGSVKSEFLIGKSVNPKIFRHAGRFPDNKMVWAAFYNQYDDSIWVLYSTHIDVRNKQGITRKTILYSSGSFYGYASSKDRLYTIGLTTLDEIDLAQGALVKTWSVSKDIPMYAIVNGQVVSRVEAVKDDGIILIPNYDVVGYYNYQNGGAWHVLANDELKGSPAFVKLGKTLTEAKKQKETYYYAVSLVVLFVAMGLFFFIRKRRTDKPVVSSGSNI